MRASICIYLKEKRLNSRPIALLKRVCCTCWLGRNDRSGSAATINKWVAEQTNNEVTQIVTKNDIDDLTQLILVNAIYFKGDWLNKFYATYTRDEDFYVSPSETLKVKMMYLSEYLHCGVNEELKCSAVELPYEGDNLSTFIVLPDQTAINLAEVEKKLSFDDLIDITETFRMESMKVKLWLPKFRLDEQLDLTKALSAMGMKDLFMNGAADLSGVDGTKELSVSGMLHRAVVDMNEVGTEAAAVTAVRIRGGGMIKMSSFRADHPFLFFIQDRATKSILFLGRLVKPPAI